ncbi:response regulator [Virgibacillus sediminis]|uniref:Response regulator n=1 Tax=Virgibacillus sediminis TaxID=202260 RepID=A0ABV7A8W5_9BACI
MKSVLIADDSQFMRKWLREILQDTEYNEIIEASNGQEAIDQYRQARPDVAFLDITMPDVDGLEALRSIRIIDPQAKVVMCSAMSAQSQVLAALKAGATDFIVKPYFDGVVDKLRKLNA